jgi:hypothetical protein
MRDAVARSGYRSGTVVEWAHNPYPTVMAQGLRC